VQGLIEEDAVKVFARNRPVIIVPRDNLQGIKTRRDLARPGVRLILGAQEGPQGVYVEQLLINASASPDFTSDFKEKV
jgi:molybdate transport system substrate-binding protein